MAPIYAHTHTQINILKLAFQLVSMCVYVCVDLKLMSSLMDFYFIYQDRASCSTRVLLIMTDLVCQFLLTTTAPIPCF